MNNTQGRDNSLFLHQTTGQLETFTESRVSEISSNHTPPIETTPNGLIKSSGQIVLIPICLLAIAWALSFTRRLDFRKTASKKLNAVKHCQQIPCSICRFYKNDPHLQCAVHPLNVASAEAINCPDFWPLDSSKFHQ